KNAAWSRERGFKKQQREARHQYRAVSSYPRSRELHTIVVLSAQACC
ncbi:unnamed protein product, partial [Ascophyllum nodosum]